MYSIRRVSECLPLCQNWVTPPPPPQVSVSPPLDQRGVEQHSLAGEGGPNSDDWKEGLALSILCGLHIQYTKSIRVSLPSSELGPPTPSPASEIMCPYLCPGGEPHSVARQDRRRWGDPIPTKGQKLWYLYYNPSTLCTVQQRGLNIEKVPCSFPPSSHRRQEIRVHYCTKSQSDVTKMGKL